MGSQTLRFIFGFRGLGVLCRSIFFGRRGVVLRDDMGVAGDCVDDDGGWSWPERPTFDGLGAAIDDDHLPEVDLGLEVLASLEDVARHLLAFIINLLINLFLV